MFEINTEGVQIKNGLCHWNISFSSPSLKINGQQYSFGKPKRDEGDIFDGQPLKVRYEPMAVNPYVQLKLELFIQWYAQDEMFKKWACIELEQGELEHHDQMDPIFTNLILQEVILEEIDSSSGEVEFNPYPPQSHPAFLNGYYVGIEYPIASTRQEEGKLLLAHKPGVSLSWGIVYETRKAIYGYSAVGREKADFQRYLRAYSTAAEAFHINYNSWWSAPLPYVENDIVQLMRIVKDKLFDPHGFSFDSFCIDLGWSNPKSIWKINKERFPEGFALLKETVLSMKSNLGLWVSPSSCYDLDAIDNEWAKEQGWEGSQASLSWAEDYQVSFLCLGGPHYYEDSRSSIAGLVEKYEIRHLKLDGYILECKEEDHGHAPGALSSETIADNAISLFQEIRRVSPEIWMESTCFGYHPSPWWLFHVSSVIGSFGDDSPFGRSPAPIYRESYTTSRDYFNLLGAKRMVIPAMMQEVLGIIHQSNDAFLNDAVMVVMRGNLFLPLYVNPKYMSEPRWKALAQLLSWTRRNSSILSFTEVLFPVSWQQNFHSDFTNEGMMPREPYGYAHWHQDKGLVALRNPWIAPCSYSFKIPSTLWDENGILHAMSIYPEKRVYQRDIQEGDMVTIHLAPYETLVLSIGKDKPVMGMVDAKDVIKSYIKTVTHDCLIEPTRKEGKSFTELKLVSEIEILTPQAEVLILLEGDSPISEPEWLIKLNREVIRNISISTSETGWAQSILLKKEHWLFLKTPVSRGKYHLDIQLSAKSPSIVSVWIWGNRPGSPSVEFDPTTLPIPELITVDAIALLHGTEINGLKSI